MICQTSDEAIQVALLAPGPTSPACIQLIASFCCCDHFSSFLPHEDVQGYLCCS
ncbi:hypothetical protein V3C99_006407 [Haemonchus contortus]